MLRLDPPIPVRTPLGDAHAFVLIDRGKGTHLGVEIQMTSGESQLSAELVASLLRYDPETGHLHWRHKTRRSNPAVRAGTLLSNGYRQVMIKGVKVGEQRVCWLLAHGSWPAEQIDHINRDRADNRLSNLRLASASLNQLNRNAPKNNTSGYKGVSWVARKERWRATIQFAGKRKHIGTYLTKEEAANAYREAAAQHDVAA